MIEKSADEFLFEKDEEKKVVFRSMIVPEKVLDNDHLQKDKV
jgi:hypothetical protein